MVTGEPSPALRWAVIVALAGLATALICYPSWPGYTSYDSIRAYEEGLNGVTSAIWPPMHAYLFRISQALGAGLGGVYFVQTFTLFLGAFVVIDALTRRTAIAALLGLGLLATFLWIPPQLGVVTTHWRDVTMTSFTVLALGAWAVGDRRRCEPSLMLAAILFGAAASLRLNSLAFIGPMAVAMVAAPWRGTPIRAATRARLGAAVVLSLAAAVGSTCWRLPDLKPISSGYSAVTTQQFDLIGISACAGRSYLPAEMVGDQVVKPADVRRLYDPRHVNMSVGGAAAIALGRPDTGIVLKRVTPRDPAAISIADSWRRAIQAEPWCYLRHRLAVFREQTGLAPGHVFAPVHGVMHPNPYGFEVAHPAASKILVDYVLDRSATLAQRQVWLYVLAIGLAVWAAWRRPAHRPLLLGVLAGAAAYAGSWLIVGPAADARYIFPSNLASALLIMASAGTLLSPRAPAPT